MAKFSTYLNFNGQAEDAFRFYQSVFGGEFFLQKMSDTPYGEQLPEAEKGRAMHVALRMPDGQLLMASDILESAGHKLQEGNNYYISAEVESRQSADECFQKLSQGGKVEMPMEDMFWGDYFGSLKDKFGIQWMISFNPNPQK